MIGDGGEGVYEFFCVLTVGLVFAGREWMGVPRRMRTSFFMSLLWRRRVSIFFGSSGIVDQ